MEKVFNGYGISIVKKDDKLYMLYDSGGLTMRYLIAEITEDESLKAQRSERGAYEVLLVIQSQRRGSYINN